MHCTVQHTPSPGRSPVCHEHPGTAMAATPSTMALVTTVHKAWALLAVLVAAGLARPSSGTINTTYETRHFNQTLDHFDPTNTARWPHRYLFSDEHWDGRGRLPNGCHGPVLMYTGNEGGITGFWESNGFMIDRLAPKFGALLVFPEERYFGLSLPFGAASAEASNLRYLSTEQVLADYVELIDELKRTLPNAANCPVVAFGGSYGGTLTTFLRVAYPNTVVGGLASSAPVGYYDPEGWAARGVSTFTWYDIVTRDYDEAHPDCLGLIERAVAEIDATPEGEAVRLFRVCERAGLGPRQSDLFTYALEGLPQLDYPYPVGSRPAWPVNATCAILVAGAARNDLLGAAVEVTEMALGYKGSPKCYPTLVEGPGGVPGDGPGPDSWGWQSCTETLHQFSARGIRNFSFNLERDGAAKCRALFNGTVTPDPHSLTQRYGGYAIAEDSASGVTNMIWSNGLLDPWHGGGFLTPGPASSKNHWILMARGAHHLDLRADHPEDPPEVTAARNQEEAIIQGWIQAAGKA